MPAVRETFLFRWAIPKTNISKSIQIMRKIYSIIAVLATLLIITSCETQTKKSVQEQQIEQILKDTISQANPYYKYTPINTVVDSLYTYSPDVEFYADFVAWEEYDYARANELLMKEYFDFVVEMDIHSANIQEFSDSLSHTLSNVNDIDSVRRFEGWVVSHTYQLTPRQNVVLPEAIVTETFFFNKDATQLEEIDFEPTFAVVRRRDEIVLKTFKKKKC